MDNKHDVQEEDIIMGVEIPDGKGGYMRERLILTLKVDEHLRGWFDEDADAVGKEIMAKENNSRKFMFVIDRPAMVPLWAIRHRMNRFFEQRSLEDESLVELS